MSDLSNKARRLIQESFAHHVNSFSRAVLIDESLGDTEAQSITMEPAKWGVPPFQDAQKVEFLDGDTSWGKPFFTPKDGKVSFQQQLQTAGRNVKDHNFQLGGYWFPANVDDTGRLEVTTEWYIDRPDVSFLLRDMDGPSWIYIQFAFNFVVGAALWKPDVEGFEEIMRREELIVKKVIEHEVGEGDEDDYPWEWHNSDPDRRFVHTSDLTIQKGQRIQIVAAAHCYTYIHTGNWNVSFMVNVPIKLNRMAAGLVRPAVS